MSLPPAHKIYRSARAGSPEWLEALSELACYSQFSDKDRRGLRIAACTIRKMKKALAKRTSRPSNPTTNP